MFSSRVYGKPVVVTCHDMLAVRGALGEIPEMRPSFAGRLLQRWIRQGIACSSQVACVSEFTRADARRILGSDHNLCKILNGLNYPFHPLDAGEIVRRLARFPELERPFILHVGSNHARKNRRAVLRIFALAARRVEPGLKLGLVFAGEPLDGELESLAQELGVRDRVIQVIGPSVEVIEALYSRALALLFPSLYEGFGWPPIEAQATGCPVVASNIPPLAEILGDSAAIFPVEDEAGMAESIINLAGQPELREGMRLRGVENVRSRFQTARMMDDYIALYRRVADLN
jgi:glycosyltransferase involved in cell wall biosynthesis